MKTQETAVKDAMEIQDYIDGKRETLPVISSMKPAVAGEGNAPRWQGSPAEQFLYNELELGIKGSANLTRSQQREIIRRLRQRDELLSACKTSRMYLMNDPSRYYDEDVNRAIKTLRAAIRNAERGQQ